MLDTKGSAESAEDCLKSVYTAHSSAVITGLTGCGTVAWSEGQGSGGVCYPYITRPGQDLGQIFFFCSGSKEVTGI